MGISLFLELPLRVQHISYIIVKIYVSLKKKRCCISVYAAAL
ncbi:hypothetical protein HMPREF7545_0399 [Selenomonas noxia ATCC 43541]|nr:hypothetical protein HMPREF7545_0399 [Selenomonas noxia ATCC 43541]